MQSASSPPRSPSGPPTSTLAAPQQPLSIIRPTPLHPLDEIPLNLPPSATTIGSSELDRNDSNAFSAPKPREADLLPVKGSAQDAQLALDKLDRLTRAKEKKDRWHHKKNKWKKNVSLQGRDKRRQDGNLSDSSSDSIDFSKAFEEVKLRITGLPGRPVVGRVKNAASRAKGRLLSGDAGSPDGSPQFEEGNESGSFRFPMVRGVTLKLSLSKPTTPTSESALGPGTSATPPTKNGVEAPSPGPDISRTKSILAQNPELLVVDEEGHERQAEEQSKGGLRRRPSPQSENSEVTLATTSASSTPSAEVIPHRGMATSTSSSSFFGGVIHDPPEEHDASTSQPDRLLSPSMSLSSTSDPSASDGGEGESSALVTDSSDDELDDLDEYGLDLGPLRKNSLSLEHGEAMTKEEIKRRKKLLRKELKRRKTLGEPIDVLVSGKAHQLGHHVGNRVHKGLNYASSKSRNRRAIEKYSPNPAKALQISTKDLSRSGTFIGSAGPERRMSAGAPFSSMTPITSREGQSFAASSRRSSMAESELGNLAATPDTEADELEGANLRRWNIGAMSVASSKRSLRTYLQAPRMLRKNHRKRWEAEMAAMEAAGVETPQNEPDPEKELDRMLGKLAAEQAPADARREKFEFDILYENQRGLLVFGIPKFSTRMLFQWDPSPWTSATNQKSPYNIANAQLPDPSWEWVYPEWLIDMTGDTDEAGWQYSGNFGRCFWPQVHFPHGKIGLPKTGAEGIMEMQARQAEKEAKRKEREEQKEDDGLEALKRTAIARSMKWQGTADVWTFVRRRRWIRLRRRRPIALPPGPESRNQTPANEVPNALGQEATLSSPEESKPLGKVSDAEDAESSSFDEEDETDDSDAYSLDHAPSGVGSSAFLPRRLPGGLSNEYPVKHGKRSRDLRAQRRALEFTGTLRELKSLLPTIMAGERDGKHSRSHSGMSQSSIAQKNALLKLNKVDARNPFISWKCVKMRLEDGDMAFATASLRAIERKHQQRLASESRSRKDQKTEPSRAAIPSRFLEKGKEKENTKCVTWDASRTFTPLSTSSSPLTNGASTDTRLFSGSDRPRELTRDALVEINYRRVLRVLKACKVDRQRLDLWKVWLGVEPLENLMETEKKEDLKDLGLLGSSPLSASGVGINYNSGNSMRYRNRGERSRSRWRSSVGLPDPSDVWDVLERRLDNVLMLCEFQSSRVLLIKTLLAIHNSTHSDHVYKDHSTRAAPIELAPTHVHGSPEEMGGGPASAFTQDGWKKAGLPRLEFFSDLQAVLSAIPGSEIANLEGASTSSLSFLQNPSMELLNHPPPSRTSSPVARAHSIPNSASPKKGLPAHQQLAVPSFTAYGGTRSPSPLIPPRASSVKPQQPAEEATPSPNATSQAVAEFLARPRSVPLEAMHRQPNHVETEHQM